MKENFNGILYLGTWEEATYMALRLPTTYDDTVYVNALIKRASTQKDVFGFQLDFLQQEKQKRLK